MGKTDKNSVLEVEQLAATITEGTKNTLRDILSEAVSSYLHEEVLNDSEDEKDIEEDETSNKKPSNEKSVETSGDVDDTEEASEEANEDSDVDNTEDDVEFGEDEWTDFDDYKISDDEGSEEYDFTNTNPETLAKVFKLMKNDDKVSVVQDGNKVTVKDNENDTEYVIELDTDSNNDLNNDFTMSESLGYTDNYQDKDPIEGLSMTGHRNKNTKDWHKGVPTGTEKPWPGKKTEKVFEITLNDNADMEQPIEETYTRGAVQDRSTTITHAREQQRARNKRRNGVQVTSTTESPVNESLKRKINAALLENKQLKETVAKVSKVMKEAVQVNVNLGHIVRLMVENSTTKAEKEDIIKRYNFAKTNEDAKALYESISAELKKSHSSLVNEQATTVENSKKINESKIYDEPNGVIDMMKRMNML